MTLGTSAPKPHDLKEICLKLAEEAAELIRTQRLQFAHRGMESAVAATKSSKVDPVTEVDKAAEQLIVARISQEFPDDSILGEEGTDRSGAGGRHWIVDPIDGTVNFLYGVPAYAVSIAVAQGNELIAGAVVNVATGQSYSASRGGGAFRDGQRIHTSRAHDVEQSLVATGFSYESSAREQQGKIIARLLPAVRDIRRIGSAALDLCRVAEGSVDIYYEHGTHPWDWAAGALIAQEAGAGVLRPPLGVPETQWYMVSAWAPGLEETWQRAARRIGVPAVLDLSEEN